MKEKKTGWIKYERPPIFGIPEGCVLIRKGGNCTIPAWLLRKVAPIKRFNAYFDREKKLIGLCPSKTGQFAFPQISALGVLRAVGIEIQSVERMYFPCTWSDEMWVIDLSKGTKDFWEAAAKFSTPEATEKAKHRHKGR